MKWTLRKWDNPELSVDKFFSNFDSIYSDFFNLPQSVLSESEWLPKIDIEEDKKQILVKADIPGLEEKDINVSLENNILTISGERTEEKKEEDEDKRVISSERRYGSFERKIALPKGIKEDDVKAEYKNGVLKIEIPRSEPPTPKKIEVKVEH